MQLGEKDKKIPPSKEIAYTAVACALLISGQYVFSFAAGVEIVSLLLVCFSYTFGVKDGVVCAIAFSLLRCLLYPFSLTAFILYLVYYPALASVFGGLGHIKQSAFEKYPWYFALAVNVLLISIASACAVCDILDVIKVPKFAKVAINVFLWIIFGLCAGLFIAFDGLLIAKKIFKKDTSDLLKLITFASIAAVCTICFTLLDDIITPLVAGATPLAALAYFYASFTAMLPQTVCTIVSVDALFLPLTAVFERVLYGRK